MNHIQSISSVRQLVADVVSNQQLGNPEEMIETMLIKDGYYCGRAYRYQQGRACWLADSKHLQFYDLDDQLIKTIDLENISVEVDNADQNNRGDDQQAA